MSTRTVSYTLNVLFKQIVYSLSNWLNTLSAPILNIMFDKKFCNKLNVSQLSYDKFVCKKDLQLESNRSSRLTCYCFIFLEFKSMLVRLVEISF